MTDSPAPTPPGRITLVGAGPGDPDLLTLKAVKAIQQASVLLVDDLVSDAIVALASRGTRVIEFNARFGDPETQAVLARLKTPLGGVLMAAAKGQLDDIEELRWAPETAVAVVLASENYPEAPRTGDRIRGLKKANRLDGVHVLHAGTATDDDGNTVSAGGRVLAVVGLGDDLQDARERAYAGIEEISLEGGQFRTDIAAKAARGEITVANPAAQA